MLSLTMEASSLGHSSTFQSQSFDGSTRIDVADGNFKNDQALHDDITAVAASVATPTDANGSGSKRKRNVKFVAPSIATPSKASISSSSSSR